MTSLLVSSKRVYLTVYVVYSNFEVHVVRSISNVADWYMMGVDDGH